jgi:CBS domain-containing protein
VKLSQVVARERIVVPLPGGSIGVSAAVLADRLAAGGDVAHPDKLRQRMREERPEDMVALGDRAFLLHYRTDAVTDLVVAIGTSSEEICREVVDGEVQCARIVLLIVAPPRAAARCLQVLSTFARLLSNPTVADEFVAQPDADALFSFIERSDYEVPEQLLVRDIMTEGLRTVSADLPLRDAAQDMVRARIGGLPVVDKNHRLVGMLSERELMRHLLANSLQDSMRSKQPQPTGRRLVSDVMTRQVLCVSPEQPLAEVASIMINKDVDRVPVVDSGELIGMLTRGDIVRKLIGP